MAKTTDQHQMEVLRQQRQRFLSAITNSNDVSKYNSDCSSVNIEKYLKKIRFQQSSLAELFLSTASLYILQEGDWNCFESIDVLKQQIPKCITYFNINVYLNCARNLYLYYFGIVNVFHFNEFLYLIVHARLFGNTGALLFEFNPDDGENAFPGQLDSNEQDYGDKIESFPTSKYMTRIKQLIIDLRTNYDDQKYIGLNVNVTYICFYILRLRVKNETDFFNSLKNNFNVHTSYVKLCPYPLDKLLPTPCKSFAVNAKLAMQRQVMDNMIKLLIHAYLNRGDESTKSVMRATFINQFQWTGLQLPQLFFKAANCYNIKESALWDILTNLKLNEYYDRNIRIPLIKLAEEYYRYSLHGNAFFPFSRVVERRNFLSLSAKYNTILCNILLYTIDLKLGCGKKVFSYKYKIDRHREYEYIAKAIKHIIDSHKTG